MANNAEVVERYSAYLFSTQLDDQLIPKMEDISETSLYI